MRFTGVCLCLFVLCCRYGSKQRGPVGPDCLPSIRRELLPVFGKGPVKGFRARQGPGNIPARFPAFNVGPERSLAKGFVQ